MIYSTKSYREAIKRLTKKNLQKYYKCLPAEVNSFLKKYSFDEIWMMNDLLRMIENGKTLKIRLPNPTMNQTKLGGFRLILFLDKPKQTISLLYVFPKTGKKKIGNISDNYEEYLLERYFNELKEGALEEIKI